MDALFVVGFFFFFFFFPPYFHFITSHYFVLGASRPVLRPALTRQTQQSAV
jgi:hypothetical protein